MTQVCIFELFETANKRRERGPYDYLFQRKLKTGIDFYIYPRYSFIVVVRYYCSYVFVSSREII